MLDIGTFGRRLAVLLPLAAALVLPWCGPARAQPPPPPGSEKRAPRLADPYDPTVPVGAVRAYIDACRRGEFAVAAGFLDLEGIGVAAESERAARLAWQLKVVLDRKLWISYELLSAERGGDTDDDLPEGLDRVGAIDGAEILLERVDAADGRRVWKFATSTVERIPELYEQHGYGPLGEFLPTTMFEIQFLHVQLWQWVGMLILILAAYVLSWLLARLIYAVVRPVVARTTTRVDDEVLSRLLAPLRFAIALGLIALGSLALALSVAAFGRLIDVLTALAVVVAAWSGLRVVDIFSSVLSQRLAELDRESAVAVLPLGRRAVKFCLIAVAAVAMLQNLGFNVTGLIAGIGVGGLALALAAQKSIANLFGGVSLVTDQPIRVGDFCKFGDKSGTVEEIGLRSTRVRTLDRTLITIPNAEFSEVQIENFAARDRFRLLTSIGLRYETSPDQLRDVLTEMRKLLVAHPRVLDTPPRVRFIGFGAFSLDLELMAYVNAQDLNEFLKIREDIFLRLMDIVEASGTGFAFPSQTLYLGRDGGLDAQRTEEAEARVRAWREENRLPFPDLPPEVVAEIDGTLDYPPRGSAAPRAAAGEDGSDSA